MNKKLLLIFNIVFALLCAIIFYLLPYIAFFTMKGDKTDIIMSMGIAIIPICLFLLSILYGCLAEKIITPVWIACAISIPYIFIPMATGNTFGEKIKGLAMIIVAVLFIAFLGSSIGTFLRRIFAKIKNQIHKSKAPNCGKNKS